MTHLVRAFAESIGAAGSPEVLGYDRIWRLGSVIVEDKAFSAVLLRGAAWADAPQAIQQSLKTLPAEKTLLFMLSNAHIDMPTGFGAVIPAQSVLHFRGGKLLIDFARIRAAVGGPDVALDMPVVSDANASVHYRNKQCSFSSRAGDLLALFKRLNRRPGTHVLFATMRHTGDIYGDCAVEDASIRSALTRLRTHFRRNKMAKLAQCLKTGTGDAGPYAVLDLSEYNNSH